MIELHILFPWGVVSLSCSWLLLLPSPSPSTVPCSLSLPLLQIPLRRAPLSFPICALSFLPLALLPGGFLTGQVSCLLPLSPFHLRCFILFPVFCVTGVLPCKCKDSLEVNQENERVGDGNAFFPSWSPIAGGTWTFIPLPASPCWDHSQRGAASAAWLPCGGALWHRLKGHNYR